MSQFTEEYKKKWDEIMRLLTNVNKTKMVYPLSIFHHKTIDFYEWKSIKKEFQICDN